MSHVPEREFYDSVEAYFEREFPDADIESSVYLAETYRFADFLVETDTTSYIVEVENDFSDAIGGVGQALLYAAHEPEYTPMLVVPDGHVEQPEWDMMQQSVIGVQVEHTE